MSRCLEKNPRERFQTALDVGNDLRRVDPALEHSQSRMHEKTAAENNASIAVLPFADMSPAKDQEYFTDGISEELLNLLAKIPDFKVAGRTSSFAFKNKNDDLRVIGEKLGVSTILEGSVRKQENQIRVTAQLVKVDDGYHLWSETYDRQLDDVFAIQDEIAAAVVNALKVTLLGELPHASVTDTRAYELYLQAKDYRNENWMEYDRRRVEMLEQAVALRAEAGADPFAPSSSPQPRSPEATPREEGIANARAEARLVLERAFAAHAELHADGQAFF